MKSEEQLKYILTHNEFPKKKWKSYLKSIGLILFSLLCLSLCWIVIYAFRKAIITNTLQKELFYIGIPFFLVFSFYGLAILFSIKNEWTADRKFREIEFKGSPSDNLKKIIEVLKNNFRVKVIDVDKKTNSVSVWTKISLLTWGNVITVICDTDRILVNSQPSGSQPFSYGQQKRNIDKLEKIIKTNTNN